MLEVPPVVAAGVVMAAVVVGDAVVAVLCEMGSLASVGLDFVAVRYVASGEAMI